MKAKKILLFCFLLSGLWSFSLALADPGYSASCDIMLVVDDSRFMKGLDKAALSAFIQSIKSDNYLGVISFGPEATVIHPLTPAPFSADILGKLNFNCRFADFNPALKLSLSHLESQGRRGARKIVVLIAEEKHLKGSGEQKFANVYAVAYGRVNSKILQEFAEKCGGKYFVAPDNLTLKDILLTISEAIQTSVIYVNKEIPVPVEEPVRQFPVTAILLLGVAAAGAVTYFIKLLVISRSRKKYAAPSFTKLRDNFTNIVKSLGGLDSEFKDFISDMEDWAAQNWQQQKNLQEQYNRLVLNILLFAEYLGMQAKDKEKAEYLGRIYAKTLTILEDEGVLEIPIKRGDVFNPMYHKYAGSRPDKISKDLILEVVRNGYYKKGQSVKEDFVFRPAEVIVSNG